MNLLRKERGVSLLGASIFLLVVVILIGAVLTYQHFGKTSVPEESPSEEEGEGGGEQGVLVDCGTAGAITFKGESAGETTGEGTRIEMKPQADEASKQAWECFADRLKNCQPAFLKSTSGGKTSGYKILEKEGENCLVSGPSVDFQTGGEKIVSCHLPLKYIEFGWSQAEEIYPGQDFMKGFGTMGAITAGGGEFEYPDGTGGNIVCE